MNIDWDELADGTATEIQQVGDSIHITKCGSCYWCVITDSWDRFKGGGKVIAKRPITRNQGESFSIFDGDYEIAKITMLSNNRCQQKVLIEAEKHLLILRESLIDDDKTRLVV